MLLCESEPCLACGKPSFKCDASVCLDPDHAYACQVLSGWVCSEECWDWVAELAEGLAE